MYVFFNAGKVQARLAGLCSRAAPVCCNAFTIKLLRGSCRTCRQALTTNRLLPMPDLPATTHTTSAGYAPQHKTFARLMPDLPATTHNTSAKLCTHSKSGIQTKPPAHALCKHLNAVPHAFCKHQCRIAVHAPFDGEVILLLLGKELFLIEHRAVLGATARRPEARVLIRAMSVLQLNVEASGQHCMPQQLTLCHTPVPARLATETMNIAFATWRGILLFSCLENTTLHFLEDLSQR